ncbi:RagB/SusD family nutrient uptake outer membrane protein [Ornithobacterium rhinotracheale]
MKKINKIIIALLALYSLSACNDFLDREPLSQVSPDAYFNNAGQLSAYTLDLYKSFFYTNKDYSMGNTLLDNNTDNQAKRNSSDDIWLPGWKKVPNKASVWKLNNIRKVNYFLGKVLPKYKAGEIEGSKAEINQAIGEAYFLRAYEYYGKLTKLGDFPIIKEPLPEDRAELIKRSKRSPRNLVARFILEDLDEAIKYLSPNPVANKNRISQEVAKLFKSRVALYEGTWLKYHRGTAFVPGGQGWPGNPQDVNYPDGYDKEIEFFLTQAKDAAEKVIKNVSLTPSNHKVKSLEVGTNPYYMMFADTDMGKYDEVLLWRSYNVDLAVAHATQVYLKLGSQSGFTQGMMDAYLGKNGKPVYKDATILASYNDPKKLSTNLATKRDERIAMFVKKRSDQFNTNKNTFYLPKFSEGGNLSATGYEIRKGLGLDPYPQQNSAQKSVNGCLLFRASEAYLNYIEAQYELEGNVSNESATYWAALRERAGVLTDYKVTDKNTDLDLEDDFAVYSAGQKVEVTLYNIRRERRCELVAEGLRMDDLKRWRALDQVKNYQVRGIKIWEWLQPGVLNSNELKNFLDLRYEPAKSPNMSSPDIGPYFYIYRIKSDNRFYEGYTWVKAHYYEPIAFEELQLAAPDGNPNNSVIYQNPGWPTLAGGVAEIN